jgi:chromosome segregation ATPase
MNEIGTRTTDPGMVADPGPRAGVSGPGEDARAAELPGLRALEERIAQAMRLIQGLKDENRRLLDERAALTARIGVLDSEERRNRIRELETRIGALEREKGDLLHEKRAVSRRIEEILEKLKFLES